MWIQEGDAVLEAHLRARGFRRAPAPLLYLERSLLDPLPEPRLPAGFALANTSSRRELALRAAASHETFGSRQPFDRYLWRYERFRRSPVYDPQLNLAVVAPDGRVASFCTCWTDPTNRVGLFEPVGTHPAFRRLGLGRAVVLAGLERLRARGMRSAAVVAESCQPAAQRLYASAGFQPVLRLFTYARPVLAAGEIHPAREAAWAEWT
jgi:ribosomal protein S18 acetylase RimI-like enzyme